MIMRFFIGVISFCLLSSVQAAQYYVTTNGNNSNSGSQSSPWRTIQSSMNSLSPGDVLNIGNGTYNENLLPTVSGTASAPIVIRASNSFGVTINGGGTSQALNITAVSYLEFEGLKLKNSGERAALQVNSKDGQPATGNTATHHITLRKMSVAGSCLNKNCNGLLIGRSNNILLEDAWVYGSGRYTVSIYGSRNITLRRVVVRWDLWYGAGYKPNDPRNAMGIYNTHNSVFENVILLDAGKRPAGTGGDKGALLLAGGDNGVTAPFVNSSNNKFYGLIVYNNVGLAVSLSARAASHNNNSFINGAIFGNDIRGITINKNVKNTKMDHMTIVGHPTEGYANWSTNTSGNVMTNSIVLNNGGYAFRGQLSESNNIMFGNAPNYASGRAKGSGSLTIDPQLIYVFKNDSTSLKNNLGSGGKRRGANLVNRYYNGVESAESLWPWLYESEIHKDMCDTKLLSDVGRTGSNTPGWCSTGKSLTRYLWNAVGSAACPTNVCDADPVASTNPNPSIPGSGGGGGSDGGSDGGSGSPDRWDFLVMPM